MVRARKNAASPSKRRWKTCKHCSRTMHPSNVIRHKCVMDTNIQFTANVNVPIHFPPVHQRSPSIDPDLLPSFPTSSRNNYQYPAYDNNDDNQDPQGSSSGAIPIDNDIPINAQTPSPPRSQSDGIMPIDDQEEPINEGGSGDGATSEEGSGSSRSSPDHNLADLLPLAASSSSSSSSSSPPAPPAPPAPPSPAATSRSYSSDWEDRRQVYEPLDAHESFLARLPPPLSLEGVHKLTIARLRKYLFILHPLIHVTNRHSDF